MVFVTFYGFSADIDAENLYSGTKNAYTLLGCLIGLIVIKALDDRFIHFQVKAVWWAQVLKTVLGLALHGIFCRRDLAIDLPMVCKAGKENVIVYSRTFYKILIDF